MYKELQGVPVNADYKEIIHNVVTTKWDFIDRLKILFTGKTVTHTQIFVKQPVVDIVRTETLATAITPKVFLKKRHDGLQSSNPDEIINP